MANEQEADKRLLEFGLGSVTWWGYSSACDLSSLIDKKGKSIQYIEIIKLLNPKSNIIIMSNVQLPLKILMINFR